MRSQASVLSQIQSASAEEVRAVLHALCADDADVCRSAGGWFEKHKRVQEARDRAAAAAEAEAAAAEAAVAQQQQLQLQQHLRQIAHSRPAVAGPSSATGSGHDGAEAENIRVKKRKMVPPAPKPYNPVDKCINCGQMFDEEVHMNVPDPEPCWHHPYPLSQFNPPSTLLFPSNVSSMILFMNACQFVGRG